MNKNKNRYPYFGVWVYNDMRAIVMFISTQEGYCVLDEFYDKPGRGWREKIARTDHIRYGWAEDGFIKLLEYV